VKRIAHSLRKPTRRGGALMVVIVALAVASMIGATLLQMAFNQRRQQQHDRLRVQAGWLADAGIQRGLQRARVETEYRGETWTLDVPGRTTTQPAEVQITVGDDKTVTAVATYPTTTTFRARVRRMSPLNPPANP
jgi:type II secretory pathway component PulK